MDEVERPYFLSDQSWYYYDDDEQMFKLTDKATEKAKESYEQFYQSTNL